MMKKNFVYSALCAGVLLSTASLSNADFSNPFDDGEEVPLLFNESGKQNNSTPIPTKPVVVTKQEPIVQTPKTTTKVSAKTKTTASKKIELLGGTKIQVTQRAVESDLVVDKPKASVVAPVITTNVASNVSSKRLTSEDLRKQQEEVKRLAKLAQQEAKEKEKEAKELEYAVREQELKERERKRQEELEQAKAQREQAKAQRQAERDAIKRNAEELRLQKIKDEANRKALLEAQKEQKLRAEAERIARIKLEAEERVRLKIEADRKAKEEAQRKVKEEAERLARIKAETEAKAREEAHRLALLKAETERKAKEEADRKAKEEADRLVKVKAENDRKAKEEADRKAKEEAERLAKIKAEANKAPVVPKTAYSGLSAATNFGALTNTQNISSQAGPTYANRATQSALQRATSKIAIDPAKMPLRNRVLGYTATNAQVEALNERYKYDATKLAVLPKQIGQIRLIPIARLTGDTIALFATPAEKRLVEEYLSYHPLHAQVFSNYVKRIMTMKDGVTESLSVDEAIVDELTYNFASTPIPSASISNAQDKYLFIASRLNDADQIKFWNWVNTVKVGNNIEVPTWIRLADALYSN